MFFRPIISLDWVIPLYIAANIRALTVCWSTAKLYEMDGRVVFSNALLCYIDQVVRKVAFPHREIVHMIGRERFRLPDFPWECFGDGWYHPPAHLRHAAWNGLKGGSEPQVVDQVNLHNLIMSKTKPLPSRKKSKGSIGDLVFAWGRCSVFGKVMSKFFLPKFGNNTRSWKKEKKEHGWRMIHAKCVHLHEPGWSPSRCYTYVCIMAARISAFESWGTR